MSPKTRSYPRGDLRRTLLDASLLLIEEQGIGALSLREVARRAGVTHAAPYHHFADKAAVMAAIADEGFVLLRDEMERAMSAAGRGPQERLAASGQGYLAFALRRPSHFRVMFRPELMSAKRGSASGESAYALLEGAIAACEEAGLAPPGQHQLLVLSAWSLVHGLASLWLDGPLSGALGAKARPQAIGDSMTTLLAQLFAAAGAASKRGRPGRQAAR